MTVNLVGGAIGVTGNQFELIELAAKHGFESVEARPHELAQLSDDQLATLNADLKKKNLVWGAAGLPIDFRRDAQGFRENLKDFPKLMAGLQRAGVHRVGTWISPSHRSLTYVQNFKQHSARLREIAKIMADHGQQLGLEYVGTFTLWATNKHPFIHTMAETKDLLDDIGESNVGLVLDSWHWWCANESADDILTLENGDIIAVDLNDAPKGLKKHEQRDNQRELPMATGVIDVAPFLKALQQLGYDGPVRAEPFNQPLNKLDNDEACAKTAAAIKNAFALLE